MRVENLNCELWSDKTHDDFLILNHSNLNMGGLHVVWWVSNELFVETEMGSKEDRYTDINVLGYQTIS